MRLILVLFERVIIVFIDVQKVGSVMSLEGFAVQASIRFQSTKDWRFRIGQFGESARVKVGNAFEDFAEDGGVGGGRLDVESSEFENDGADFRGKFAQKAACFGGGSLGIEWGFGWWAVEDWGGERGQGFGADGKGECEISGNRHRVGCGRGCLRRGVEGESCKGLC